MDIHFSRKEFAARRRATLRAMAARDLDGLLMFRQESMYYLTGLHTFGYCFFQCVYLGADGKMTLLTRLPDAIVAKQTTILEDVRTWENRPDANPARNLRTILEERSCRGRRLGIELDAYGLTAYNHRRVAAALDDFCRLEDASDLVTGLRVIKSPKELQYCRKAGRLADAALEEALRLAVPGAWEGDILAAMQGAVFRGDGDYSGNEFIIGSGPRASFGRYVTGRRRLGVRDLLTLEWAGAYRFYHAAMMRTLMIGKPTGAALAIHDAALDAHRASAEQLQPGRRFGDVFDAYSRVVTKAGYAHLGATGYSLGATFPPTWMDWPMCWPGNEIEIREGMVVFIHTIIMSKNRRLAQAPGQSYIVRARGPEALSRLPLSSVAR